MEFIVIFSLSLLIVSGPGLVSGLPNGAPVSACSTLLPDPSSHVADPQTSATPYTLDLSNLTVEASSEYKYIPGYTYTCKYTNFSPKFSSLTNLIVATSYCCNIEKKSLHPNPPAHSVKIFQL